MCAVGIARPTGGYVERMLGQAGWPEVDEDTLYGQAHTFTQILRQVDEILAGSRHEQSQIFGGGIWSGDAAEAANSTLDKNLNQLATLQDDLTAAITWHEFVAGSIVQAKSEIGDRVEAACQLIRSVENDRALDAAERAQAIDSVVSATLGANVSVVTETAEQILASRSWKSANTAGTGMFDQQATPGVAYPGPFPPAPPSRGEGEHQQAGSAESVPADPAPVLFGELAHAPGAAARSVIPAKSPDVVSAEVPRAASGATPVVPSPAALAVPNEGPSVPVTDASAQLTRSGDRLVGLAPATVQQKPAGSSDAEGLSPPMMPITATPSSASGGASAAGPGGRGAGAGPGAATGRMPSRGPHPYSSTPRATRAPTWNDPAGRAISADRIPAPDVAAMASIPVSAARAARDAALAACISDAARRDSDGTDPLQLARRIAAALNAPSPGQANFGFFWVAGVTTDGAILVANSYGLAYIPVWVRLPERVNLVSAEAGIPVAERASWATYPLVAVQRWAALCGVGLRAVIAPQEYLANCDPGVATVALEPDDIPTHGTMTGRARLEVVDPAAAMRLASTTDPHLIDLLPPAPADADPRAQRRFKLDVVDAGVQARPVAADDPPFSGDLLPSASATASPTAYQRRKLWFEVQKPMMSKANGRAMAHLRAFRAYAVHAQEVAVEEGHAACDSTAQRLAIARWLYWGHLDGLLETALGSAP